MVMKLTMVNQKKLEYGQPWFVGRPWSQGGKSMVDHGGTHIQPWLNHGYQW
jgi:hypothetical protein